MPVWVNSTALVLSIAVGLAAIGCNATCIRDTDCLGRAICSENRCILLVGGDAGRGSSSPGDTNDDGSNEPDASTTRDAGD